LFIGRSYKATSTGVVILFVDNLTSVDEISCELRRHYSLTANHRQLVSSGEQSVHSLIFANGHEFFALNTKPPFT